MSRRGYPTQASRRNRQFAWLERDRSTMGLSVPRDEEAGLERDPHLRRKTLAVQPFRNRDVGHACGGRGSVPVLLSCVEPNRIA